ncbi:MAG TPA: hypothetical protein VGH90_10210 [Chthoniobacteraceae bacterium]
MKLICAAALGLLFAAPAEAVTIESPNVGKTAVYNSIGWHQLRWIADRRLLVASMTFDNRDYESSEVRREEDRVDFAFPGVSLDPASGVFYATEGHERVEVAAIHRGWFGKEIRLAPGARIETTMRAGKVRAALTANSDPVKGPQWAERR